MYLNLPALAQCRTNVMGQRWADEQTLGWPIQYLQPWANRAASNGPMEGQCIRAIWDMPEKNGSIGRDFFYFFIFIFFFF